MSGDQRTRPPLRLVRTAGLPIEVHAELAILIAELRNALIATGEFERTRGEEIAINSLTANIAHLGIGLQDALRDRFLDADLAADVIGILYDRGPHKPEVAKALLAKLESLEPAE
jgi:hypothetical protein